MHFVQRKKVRFTFFSAEISFGCFEASQTAASSVDGDHGKRGHFKDTAKNKSIMGIYGQIRFSGQNILQTKK